jgi:NAD(P)-dependent dehydrogenase (short-subunit alcohol dehydrogenase family)
LKKKQILITGASGLLGRALVKEFLDSGFIVLAQYHSRQPFQHENCRWLPADFSDINGIREFLNGNLPVLKECEYLINNYGPITSKKIPDLTAEDFYFDFHHNLITAFEITSFLTGSGMLKSVVNVGFEFAGEIRAYRHILTYAAAKNALYVLTESFKEYYPGIGFHMVFPRTMEGAQVKSGDGVTVSPGSVAKEIFTLISK